MFFFFFTSSPLYAVHFHMVAAWVYFVACVTHWKVQWNRLCVEFHSVSRVCRVSTERRKKREPNRYDKFNICCCISCASAISISLNWKLCSVAIFSLIVLFSSLWQPSNWNNWTEPDCYFSWENIFLSCMKNTLRRYVSECAMHWNWKWRILWQKIRMEHPFPLEMSVNNSMNEILKRKRRK